MIRFGDDWGLVLRKAWSVRLWLLAFACGAADVVLSVLGQVNADAGWRIGLQLAGLALGLAGLLARVLVQKDLP